MKSEHEEREHDKEHENAADNEWVSELCSQLVQTIASTSADEHQKPEQIRTTTTTYEKKKDAKRMNTAGLRVFGISRWTTPEPSEP